jgi:hypothetical protein
MDLYTGLGHLYTESDESSFAIMSSWAIEAAGQLQEYLQWSSGLIETSNPWPQTCTKNTF